MNYNTNFVILQTINIEVLNDGMMAVKWVFYIRYNEYNQEYIRRRESIKLRYVPRKHRWESNVTYA